MKKFGLLIVGGIASIILLTTIGPIIGLALCLTILYFIIKKFLKVESTTKKIVLAVLGFIVLMATIHNIPSLIGIGAAYVLYLVYKEWSKGRHKPVKEESDPFINFEKQWDELKHN